MEEEVNYCGQKYVYAHTHSAEILYTRAFLFNRVFQMIDLVIFSPSYWEPDLYIFLKHQLLKMISKWFTELIDRTSVNARVLDDIYGNTGETGSSK